MGEVQDKKRICIVDDHPVFRKGLAQLIDEEADLVVVGEAEGVREAILLIGRRAPDLVIVDISLKDSSGIDLIEYISENFPGLPVLVISMHDEGLYAQRVLRAGALGYTTKQEMTDNVVKAVRQVMDGKRYVSEAMMDALLGQMVSGGNQAPLEPVKTLSNRELEVFQLIGQGYKRREIADLLYLSVKTIGTYRESIKKKLNLKTANELMRYAVTFTQGKT